MPVSESDTKDGDSVMEVKQVSKWLQVPDLDPAPSTTITVKNNEQKAVVS